MDFGKIINDFKTFKFQENQCFSKLEGWEDKLCRKLDKITSKKALAGFAVPYALAKTALAIAFVVAPLFDAFINFGIKMHKNETNSRVKIGLEFPEELARKVGFSALFAVLITVTPIHIARTLGYKLHEVLNEQTNKAST